MATYQVDTVAALNAGTYAPGDVIKLKRGNVYQGPVIFSQSGTSAAPIQITSYGDATLPLPQIKGTATLYVDALTLTGTCVNVDHLLITDTNRSAVAFTAGSSYINVQFCEMTRVGEGANILGNNNKFLLNYVHDLTMVKNTDSTQPPYNANPSIYNNDDYGANGFVIGGSNIECAYNRIIRAKALSYDYGADGSGFDIFTSAGQTLTNINIHHNYFDGCDGVFEGGGPVNTGASINNLSIHHNVCVNNGVFATVHNAGGSFGCAWSNVIIQYNTIVDELNTSGVGLFVVFDGGSPAQIAGFQISQNIIAMNDGNYLYKQNEQTTHTNNCYYFGVALAAGGASGLHIYNDHNNAPLGASEFIASPLFTNQAARDFTLLPGSPAAGFGGGSSALTTAANAAFIAALQQGTTTMGNHPSFGPTGASATYQSKTDDESDGSTAGTVVLRVNPQIGGALISGSNPLPVSGTVSVSAQRAESLWTDDTGVYFVRIDQGGTVTWTDLSGNALSTPGTGARPAAGTTTLVSRTSFQATAAATGYSVGDLIDHFETTDPSSGVVLGNFWINVTTGLKLASGPAAGNLGSVSTLAAGAATSALQGTGNTSLAAIATALGGALSVVGNIAEFQTQFGPASSTTYAAGQVMSGPIQVTGMGRVAGGAGAVVGAKLALNVLNTVEVDIILFNAAPSGTYTAGAAYPNVAADRLKYVGTLKITDWTALSTTDSAGEIAGLSKAYVCKDGSNTQSLWAVPVTRGSITIASATDATLTIDAQRA